MTLLRRLPAHIINGLTVAIGVACIRLLLGALAGPLAAQLAASGAIGASLADIPLIARRSQRRVLLAATLSVLAALLVALIRGQPLLLGIGVALAGGAAMLLTAWGPPASGLSFVPILVMVFSLAAPAATGPTLEPALWNGVGAVAYLVWSTLTSRLLERHYRTLAVAQAIAASAQQLRARAALLESPPQSGSDGTALRNWIAAEATLADSLQNARDFAYAAPAGADYPRNTALLQHVFELRDQLMTSSLDLHLLGTDTAAHAMLRTIAGALQTLATALDTAARGLRLGHVAAMPVEARPGEPTWFGDIALAPDDPRARLLAVIVNRQRHLAHEVQRIHALVHSAPEESRLNPAELLRFVSPESWRLRDLRLQLAWHSPVLRHALRTTVALGSAYFIALALPWSSHPHWLILSVAVVLRGNLEQTLARRNMRIVGTLLGCAAVMALLATQSPTLLDLTFMLAVGVAHAFAMRLYWLTATAATIMALLQAHLVDPGAGLPIAERAADTVLGALLAWGFSYMLPSWERRRLPQALTRALQSLGRYAELTLADQGGRVVLEQRLARRRSYDALNELGALLQRSSAEPRNVQVPDRELATLLDHAQRFMAHLSMVRLTLTRRTAELSAAAVAPMLAETSQALAACFDTGRVPATAHNIDVVDELGNLPAESPDEDAHPWLARRLQLLVHEAALIRRAARSMRSPP